MLVRGWDSAEKKLRLEGPSLHGSAPLFASLSHLSSVRLMLEVWAWHRHTRGAVLTRTGHHGRLFHCPTLNHPDLHSRRWKAADSEHLPSPRRDGRSRIPPPRMDHQIPNQWFWAKISVFSESLSSAEPSVVRAQGKPEVTKLDARTNERPLAGPAADLLFLSWPLLAVRSRTTASGHERT